MVHLYTVAPLAKALYIDCAVHSPIHTLMVEETMQGSEQLGVQSLAQGLFHTNPPWELGTFQEPSLIQRRFLYP